ncbi:MAG: type II toxin-antitoxin system HicB family antitoxin [Gammaproteobacteria bacterium]|nr:MAG: type II toxin-antitoxin system HicB family antitoxin [Gammaproteobacteria bacterium]
MNVLYPAIFEYDRAEKRYTVSFPDLSEAITEGETLEEAFFNASEVLTLTLEGRMDEGVEIPMPSRRKNAKQIAPSARAQAALLMRWAKGEHTTAEIARALNTSWPAIARLENPHHWPNLRQLERAAAAIGQKLVISLEPVSTDMK